MSYPGIFFLMLLENMFPPLPSELVMSLAGYRAGQGELNLWGAIVAGSVGSLVGQLPLYYVGKWIGKERLRAWAERHGEWLALSGEDIEQADRWFDRYGSKAVLLGRLVPGVRCLIAFPAGFSGMPLGKFLAYSAVGTTAWSAVPAYFGKVLGENYQQVGRYVGAATWVALALTTVWFVAMVVKRRHERKAKAGTKATA